MYLTVKEKEVISKAAKARGISIAKFLLEAVDFYMASKKNRDDLAREFRHVRMEREAKARERDTGDFLGSKKKLGNKLERIKRSDESPEIKEMLMKEAKSNYRLTRAIKAINLRKRQKKSTKEKDSEDVEIKGRGLEFCKGCNRPLNCNFCRHYLMDLKKYDLDKAVSIEKLRMKCYPNERDDL